jgi:hypothetical protein
MRRLAANLSLFQTRLAPAWAAGFETGQNCRQEGRDQLQKAERRHSSDFKTL